MMDKEPAVRELQRAAADFNKALLQVVGAGLQVKIEVCSHLGYGQGDKLEVDQCPQVKYAVSLIVASSDE